MSNKSRALCTSLNYFKEKLKLKRIYGDTCFKYKLFLFIKIAETYLERAGVRITQRQIDTVRHFGTEGHFGTATK